ncbi:two component transcriptional regulator, LuxR family [Stackebrandtia albiflava]|uniref:Two component transcriptional regulator, LuxR family n=1 Tax=Stackebrandtia albiflava TaxID=406432 RepID=A0A562V230_9ACTN|nr:response regulator transcription factor [Stackebrandtia albiflava]TWJ11934.1 two component transcriptional regulator, LuxR family [Stackebrandtia albiflava]
MTSVDSPGVRVVIVDDQSLVREGLRALLERAEDITVVGEAGDGRDGVAVVSAERPDVVLMDIRMPGTDGIAATRQIVADPALAGVKVVVLTTFDTDRHIIDAVRAGACGFLLKDVTPDRLREAVRIVAAGDALLSPAVTRRVMRAAAVAPTGLAAERLSVLTDREREVLAELGAGRNNEEIGARLHMSPATARTHIGRLLSKLGARDRAQLVVAAYETGLVRPGDPA